MKICSCLYRAILLVWVKWGLCIIIALSINKLRGNGRSWLWHRNGLVHCDYSTTLDGCKGAELLQLIQSNFSTLLSVNYHLLCGAARVLSKDKTMLASLWGCILSTAMIGARKLMSACYMLAMIMLLGDSKSIGFILWGLLMCEIQL